jgi:hypothetical protein
MIKPYMKIYLLFNLTTLFPYQMQHSFIFRLIAEFKQLSCINSSNTIIYKYTIKLAFLIYLLVPFLYTFFFPFWIIILEYYYIQQFNKLLMVPGQTTYVKFTAHTVRTVKTLPTARSLLCFVHDMRCCTTKRCSQSIHTC